MPRRRTAADLGVPAAEPQRLRHILLVGGSLGEWSKFDSQAWLNRRSECAKVAARHGAMWLTIRPYARGVDDHIAADRGGLRRAIDPRDGCTVTVDPCPDGRDRLLGAIEQLREASVTVIDEAAIAAVLMSPAPCEPDLTIILGPSTHLPQSLVWDLAYSELVFVDVSWSALTADHIETAISQYFRRHRRFGGIE
jgi:undecaprenyl diphosphate synthase